MKVSLDGLYRFIQLKTGDATHFCLEDIPDVQVRFYITQLLMRLKDNLRSESDLQRIEHMLDRIVANAKGNITVLDALERLVMLL